MTGSLSFLAGRAALFEGSGKQFRMVDVPLPVPEAGEIAVRVRCCTVCGSDLHTQSGRRASPSPSVLGHEIVGEIVRSGDSKLRDHIGQRLETGDRITWSVAASCGTCDRCVNEMPQKCRTLLKYGHEKFSGRMQLSGGLADYCLLQPGTTVVRVPDHLSDEVVCPASCATATSFAAVRRAGELAGKSVLVLGAGLLGLTTCAIASSRGANEIFLCDVDDTRLQRGPDFGATRTGHHPSGDFDRVFEMSGHSEAVQAGLDSAAMGGRVVLVGSVSPAPSVSLDPEKVVRRLMTICGVHNYIPADLVSAVEFLATDGQSFPFANLVERKFALAEVNEAFSFAREKRPVRVAVCP